MNGGAGVDMAYDSSGLLAGGGAARTAAGVAEAAVGALQGAVLVGAAFGRVAGADTLVAALGRARGAHARTAQQAGARHVDLHGRAGRSAAAGDQLVADSTGVAARGTRGSISAQML